MNIHRDRVKDRKSSGPVMVNALDASIVGLEPKVIRFAATILASGCDDTSDSPKQRESHQYQRRIGCCIRHSNTRKSEPP